MGEDISFFEDPSEELLATLNPEIVSSGALAA
jgi:hypothetical protein